MNTLRKELEFPAPPEGWEIDRYGNPTIGEKYHDACGWHDYQPMSETCYIIARKKQSPAEWANAQPDLAALARLMEEDTNLVLRTGKSHYINLGHGDGLNVFTLHAEYSGQNSTTVVCHRSQWVDRA